MSLICPLSVVTAAVRIASASHFYSSSGSSSAVAKSTVQSSSAPGCESRERCRRGEEQVPRTHVSTLVQRWLAALVLLLKLE